MHGGGDRYRVLHVQKATGVGGSEQHLVALLSRLDRTRFAPSLLVLEDPAHPCPDFLATLEHHGIPHAVAPIRRDLDLPLLAHLVRRFRRERPDIVHTHLIHADLLAIPAARLARVPVVVTSKHGANPFREGVVGWFDGRVSRLADRVIVISDYLKGFYRDVEGIPGARLSRIHYGLPPEGPSADADGTAARDELGVARDAPVVGIVSRLVEGKGHDDLLAAFSVAREAFPRARLVVVGDGPLRPALEARVDHLGLRDAVIFTGFRGDVDRLLAAFDLFVLPSLSEGFGLAILEAMRAARAVVATAVAAIPEIVVDGVTGHLVPPRDPRALAAAMVALLRDPQRRMRLGRAGRERFLAEFNVERMVEAIARVYTESVTPEGPPPVGPMSPPDRPRVVRVITRLNIGGPAQHAVLLTAYLQRAGWPVTLVVGRVDPPEGDMADLAAAHGVEPVVVPALRNRAWPGEDLAAAVALYRLFRRDRPDVVHLHLLKARLLGGVAARLAGVPRVVETIHGTLLAEYYNPLVRRLVLLVERWLARRMDAVIAVSDTVAQELLQARVLPRQQAVHVIPLGLPLQQYLEAAFIPGVLRRELGIGRDAPLVGTVGRLVPIKGLGYFLDAAAEIIRHVPRAQFVLVGDGPQRSALERQVGHRGLRGQVHFTGWRRSLERIYPDLDLVMLTSLHEGTPVSLLEAMAAGRAVLATRVGGVPDVVEDGVSGVLVPPKDPAALAAAAVRLLQDDEERRRLGEAARRAVYPRFTVERLAKDMHAFYRGLVGDAVEAPR